MMRWAALAAVIFLFTSVYRFNTLGGALGGFDDDHFLLFAYGKQVQAGEQPLRDYAGMGLQGARPALAFELSAAAQSWLGNNLRSEALVCVAALGLAAALTFTAARLVSQAWIAAPATILSVFLAPKLYNYPKVLMLAAAALAVAVYARRPSRATAVALGGVTATAFLFRHDLAVYTGLAAIAVIALSARSLREAAAGLASYGAVIAVLLTPSLVLVARDRGLGAYAREGLEQASQESGRTQIAWPRFTTEHASAASHPSSFLDHEQNAIAWLYYAHLAIPLVLLVVCWRGRSSARPRHERAAVAAIAAASLLVAAAFLRGNTSARFGDMGPWFAVLLAAAASWSLGRSSNASRVGWGVRAALVAIMFAATAQSVWTIGSVARELDASGWSDSGAKVIRQARRYWTELASLPGAYWSGEPASPSLAAVQYLHRCMATDSRAMMIGYEPELLPLADRRFAGGRAVIVPGFLTDAPQQRRMIDWWRIADVPLVMADEDPGWREDMPLIAAVLADHYSEAGTLDIDGGVRLQLFARRSPGPVGTLWDLPCFR